VAVVDQAAQAQADLRAEIKMAEADLHVASTVQNEIKKTAACV